MRYPKFMIYILRFGFIGWMLFITTTVHASVLLKVSATNPSEFAERNVVVKSYLPKRIKPEDVIDSDELDVGYDVKREQSYVYKDVILPAQTTVTYSVEIEDIWLIDDEKLNKIQDRFEQLVSELQDSEYAAVSRKIKDTIDGRINEILTRQDEFHIDRVSPIDHIGAYEVNQEILDAVKDDLASLEMMMSILKGGRIDQKSVRNMIEQNLDATAGNKKVMRPPSITYFPRMLPSYMGITEDTSCLVKEAMDGAAGKVSFSKIETVNFKIEVENPSKYERQNIPVQYYLAKEVKALDVIDTGGLDLSFDFGKELYYVFQEEVELEPDEKKTFEVVLNNKWSIDKTYLISLRVYVEGITLALKNFNEFAAASQIKEKVIKDLDNLLERKSSTEFTEQHVTVYREDMEKMDRIRRDISEIENISAQTGIMPGMAIAEREVLCQEDEERSKKGTGTIGGLKLKEIKLMAGTIFRGRSFSTAATWRIILYIIAFLGFITSIFYFINIKQQKSTMFDPLTGAFGKEYISERFREELKIAKGSQNKCSLLVMDVDKFKAINDTYGHAVGDIILKEFVIATRKAIRLTDLVGRFGGDEFLIILPTSEKDTAHKIAQGIAKKIEEHKVKVGNEIFNITTSIGVATYPEDSATAEDMFNKADKAMYEVKKQGGNGVSVFG
jgi:diguanylate cyclase (GGDEF)-like protein